jgi:hypothetical protein
MVVGAAAASERQIRYLAAEAYLPDDAEKPQPEENALVELNDEIMSMLHAQQLRQESVPSETVKKWLQGLYDIAQVGLGKPRLFRRDDPNDAKAAR